MSIKTKKADTGKVNVVSLMERLVCVRIDGVAVMINAM